MVLIIPLLLNTSLMNGNVLEIFNDPEVATEQSLMVIAFMSSVDWMLVVNCKFFIILILKLGTKF